MKHEDILKRVQSIIRASAVDTSPKVKTKGDVQALCSRISQLGGFQTEDTNEGERVKEAQRIVDAERERYDRSLTDTGDQIYRGMNRFKVFASETGKDSKPSLSLEVHFRL